MKRKQFLTRLLKISELHQSLNPIREIALISTKMSQNKEKEQIPEPMVTRILPTEAVSTHFQDTSIKSREVVVMKQELVTSKVLIHAKGNNTSCRKIPSRRRMRTTPTHSKLNSSQVEDLSKLLQDNSESECLYDQAEVRKYQYITTDLNISDTLPHYLQIRELQPKVLPRKNNQKESPTKRISTKINQIPRLSRIKKHSLTQPTDVFRKQSNSQRKMELQCNRVNLNAQNNYSIRSDSFKKYRSMNQNVSNQEKLMHNKIKLNVRKQINKNYTKPFMPPPKITAKSYIIYEVKERKEESKVIVAFNSKNSQEVASLTKIMTCIVSLQICSEFGINKATQQILIGKMESSVGGTTASLAHGQIYTVDQLLLGLMLPSGNDASMALAIWGGRKLLEKQQQSQINITQIKSRFTKIQCYNRFIIQMNAKAKELNMNKTNYANSHGLMNPNNKSSAYDIALLCDYAMRNELFRAIVRCKQYKGVIKFSEDCKKNEDKIYKFQSEQGGSSTDLSQNQRKSPSKQFSFISALRSASQKNISVQWENTHKLLHLKPRQYIGIKTGYTVAAGPCLSSFVSISDRNFIIIVLGCGRVNLRFKQTQTLRKWLVKHQNLKRKKIKTAGKQLTMEQQQEEEEEQVQFLLQNMKHDEEKED